MAPTNFILTVAAVGAGMLLFTTDIRKSAPLFRRNARQIKHWPEEDTAAAASKVSAFDLIVKKIHPTSTDITVSGSAKETASKKLDSTVPKEKLKEDSH